MDLHAFFNKEENKQFLDIALELAARRDEMVTIQFSAIAKEIKSRYKDYEINVWDSGKGVSVRHSKFDEIKKFCFYIAAEIIDTTSVYFEVYLDNYDTKQTTKLTPILKEVLGVSNNDVFDTSTLEDDKYYLALKESDEVDLKDFTQEKFINFFESVRKQTDEFNQKIKDDLAKGQDSKLRKFLTDNN